MNIQKALLLATSLTACSAIAQETGLSPMSVPHGSTVNELAIEHAANLRADPGGKFFYINLRTTATQCGVPLTLQEKLRQQNGADFPFELKAQRNSFSDSALGMKLTAEIPHLSHALPLLGTLLWSPFYSEVKLSLAVIDSFEVRDVAARFEVEFFGEQYLDDEADAFRHYFGTYLLAQRVGVETAQKLVNAHENLDRSISSLMDRYNNLAAIRDFTKFKKENRRLTTEELAARAAWLARTAQLVVLKPRLSNLPPPPDFYPWAHELLNRRIY